MGLERTQMVEKRGRLDFGAWSTMVELGDVDFGTNSTDTYTPQGSPNPWRKSTKSGEHEAAGISTNWQSSVLPLRSLSDLHSSPYTFTNQPPSYPN